MCFKDELIALTNNYNSKRLIEIKEKLLCEASEGKKETTICLEHCDEKWLPNWLKAQKLEYSDISDVRDAVITYKIKW